MRSDWHRSVLSCRGLRKSFDEHVVVDDVWFDVQAGEAYGLVGLAGSGKTTTVRMACGLLGADGGTVALHGRPIDSIDLQSLKESVGYVAQSVVALLSGTVAETLRFWARLLGLSRQQCGERIAETLALVGLESHSGDRVDRCSSGVLRELSLAVALLHRPRLLVLDEPTMDIDPQSRERLLSTLGRLRNEGTAVLYASRNADEVRRLCDRVGTMDRGRLITEDRFGEDRFSGVPLPAA
ncbi:MAG: ABC transporter ATP-binding protein [Pseudonocardiales bacterium]